VQRWLNVENYAAMPPNGDDHDHPHPAHDVNRHDEHIKAVCLVLEQPIPGDALDRWFETLLALKGPDLLRFKAIVNVAELPGPLVLQGVQHVIYPPLALKQWPSDDRRTRMVFITHDIDAQTLRDSLAKFTEEATSAPERRSA
jgi:G3E family GTPase